LTQFHEILSKVTSNENPPDHHHQQQPPQQESSPPAAVLFKSCSSNNNNNNRVPAIIPLAPTLSESNLLVPLSLSVPPPPPPPPGLDIPNRQLQSYPYQDPTTMNPTILTTTDLRQTSFDPIANKPSRFDYHLKKAVDSNNNHSQIPASSPYVSSSLNHSAIPPAYSQVNYNNNYHYNNNNNHNNNNHYSNNHHHYHNSSTYKRSNSPGKYGYSQHQHIPPVFEDHHDKRPRR
jgi:hypothetical protein